MAKRVGAGELRTKIRVFGPPSEGSRDKDGYPTAEAVNVFGPGAVRHCKWVNAYGSEVLDAKRLGVEELATLTMRYTPKLTATCEIYRGEDENPYEVISINDVEDRHVWLEARVQRKAGAK